MIAGRVGSRLPDRRLVGRLLGCLDRRLVGRLLGCLDRRFVGRLLGCLDRRLVGRLRGGLLRRLDGRLRNRFRDGRLPAAGPDRQLLVRAKEAGRIAAVRSCATREAVIPSSSPNSSSVGSRPNSSCRRIAVRRIWTESRRRSRLVSRLKSLVSRPARELAAGQ